MKPHKKYAVYINSEWFNALCVAQYGNDASSEERNHLREVLNKNVQDFLAGDATAFLCDTFVGADGKRHKAVEFQIIEGRHSGRPLKRLKIK